MSIASIPLTLLAQPLKFYRQRRPAAPPRILVIRRNRMGDMLCTLPLLRMIRLHFANAHLVVACDTAGEAVARACDAVNEVIVLEPGWNRLHAAFKNARRLQDFDWVVAAKGGYDGRLALLTRLTNAAVRVGFSRRATSAAFTEPVVLSETFSSGHQIEMLLRLGSGLGISNPTFRPDWLQIQVPEEARAFAKEILARPPFSASRRFVLINLSSTVPLRAQTEDLREMISRLLAQTDAGIGFVFAPHDQVRADEWVAAISSERVVAVPTPGAMELAALLERCTLFITPEGGAAHLAAAVNASTVVLWSEGPFEKWKPRGARQTFAIVPNPKIKFLTFDQIWSKVEPHLAALRPR